MSNNEHVEFVFSRRDLPSANIQLLNEIDLSEKDLESKQTDRTRLFAHERGNWPLSIFVLGRIEVRR
jgi:hypothetical protein